MLVQPYARGDGVGKVVGVRQEQPGLHTPLLSSKQRAANGDVSAGGVVGEDGIEVQLPCCAVDEVSRPGLLNHIVELLHNGGAIHVWAHGVIAG